MDVLPPNPIPEVYVLWHPSCPLGEKAARAIYRWLRPDKGQGPMVFYRSLPAPDAPPGGLPLPLPSALAPDPPGSLSPFAPNLQIVLPLIDCHMIADPAWRYWLEVLGRRESPPSRIVPVALDSTAFGAPAPIRRLNFIRPTNTGEGDDGNAGRIRSLLKQLTEILCAHLLGSEAGGNAPSPAGLRLKLRIFLSHAKADGMAPARAIRDYIYSQTQLAAFYDENDIPFGAAFAPVLDTAVPESAAMIAVRSAKYADRPWCRRELSAFRRPRLDSSPAPAMGEQWSLPALLVVDSLEDGASTTGIPELGNSPTLRWAPQVKDQAELVVTTLMRDALLRAFHRSVGARRRSPGDIVLNWLPDPVSLLPILSKRPGVDCRVHYPGQLSGLDLDLLEDLYPGTEFVSFEEMPS